MPITLLTGALLSTLWLGMGFVLLGLDWWQPSAIDAAEYLIGGALIILPLSAASPLLLRWARRDRG